MKRINTRSVLRSAERLEEFESGHQKADSTMKPVWLFFLKRESSILARRAIKMWLRLRFRRVE